MPPELQNMPRCPKVPNELSISVHWGLLHPTFEHGTSVCKRQTNELKHLLSKCCNNLRLCHCEHIPPWSFLSAVKHVPLGSSIQKPRKRPSLPLQLKVIHETEWLKRQGIAPNPSLIAVPANLASSHVWPTVQKIEIEPNRMQRTREVESH